MKNLFCIILMIASSKLAGQNYIDYQKTFNRIDEDVLTGNYGSAIKRLDSVHNNYEFVFAKHCIKALQVCCYLNDSIHANKWLAKSFKQGIPLWIIRTNELTKKALAYSLTYNTILKYDSLHSIYTSSINKKLANQIDSLLEIDQRSTRRVNDGFLLLRYTVYYLNWKRNNKKEFHIINAIIDQYGYPGERLIGLPSYLNDSASASKNIIFYGPNIFDSRAYTMLIHYFSTPRKDINEKLKSNLETGSIPAWQYGDINDMMADRGNTRYGAYLYYNTWHFDPVDTHIEEIDLRRHQIGINNFSVQQRNMLLNRDRRKNKKANSEIILE